MTGKERDAWEGTLVRGRGTARRTDTRNARATLAVRCLVDAQGARLFTNADAERLGNIRVDYLQKIFEAAQRLSGVTDDDIADLADPSVLEASAASSSS